jgi:hypothetical protein
MYSPTLAQSPPEANAATAVLSASRNHFKNLVAHYLSSYNRVWNNPFASPDKVVAALGTNAAGLFEISSATAAFLNQFGANVPATSPAGWTVVFGADGSGVATKS